MLRVKLLCAKCIYMHASAVKTMKHFNSKSPSLKKTHWISSNNQQGLVLELFYHLPNSTNITRRLPSGGEIPNPTRCGVNGPIQAIVPCSTIQTRKLSASRGTCNNKFKFKFLYCLFYREYIEDYIYNKGYNNRNVYLLTAARISQNLGMRIWTLSLIFKNKIQSNL